MIEQGVGDSRNPNLFQGMQNSILFQYYDDNQRAEMSLMSLSVIAKIVKQRADILPIVEDFFRRNALILNSKDL